MKDLEFLKLFGDIDCDMVCECLPARAGKKPQKTVCTVPRFLSRAASVAAAAVLALFISTATAEAAGVRVVTPFISWTGSTLRLDYSAGLDQHEDAPEITADPSHKPVVSSIPSERVRFTSEEEFKARVGNMIRLPGDELGLEFVEAEGFIDDHNTYIFSIYLYKNNQVRIESRHHAASFDSENSAYRVEINNVLWSDTKEICGIEGKRIRSVNRNYLSIVLENESYLIYGKADMDTLESIFASMIGAE